MSSEISNSINNQQLANARRHGETNAAASSVKRSGKDGSSPSAVNGDDNVSLTETALHVRDVEHRLADASVINRERVEELRQAIVEGTYSIRADYIAEKVIELERQLGGKN